MSSIHASTNLLVNTSSLLGQLSLNRTESALSTAIRNLSSGLRIHSGRDDPSGFIASNAMRTDITSTAQAVANCERAGAVISTADSALGQMNNLLNDLRGLVVQAANTGGENDATLRALQLEADSALDAIDRISNQTQFQQQKLIDGSLDFTTYGLDTSKLAHYQINQANFLGRVEKDISVKVLEPATQGELYYPYGALANNVALDVGGTNGYHTYFFDRGATAQQIADEVNRNSDATGVAATVHAQSTAGTISLTSYGKDNDVLLTASRTGVAAGNIVVSYTAPEDGNDEAYLNVSLGYGNEPTIIEIVLQTEPGGNVLTTAEQIVSLINTSEELRYSDETGMVTASLPNGTTGLGTVTPFTEYSYYGDPMDSNFLQFLGPAGSPTIKFVSTPGTPLSVEEKTVDGEAMVLVHLETDANGLVKTTANDLVKFFDNPGSEESKAVLDRLGISVSIIDPTSTTLPVCTLGEAPSGVGVLKPTYDPNDPDCVDHTGQYPDIIFTSSGRSVQDDPPDSADTTVRGAPMLGGSDRANLGITFHSTDYGSGAFVSVIANLGTDFPLTDQFGNRAIRSTGTDVVALINNEPAIGNGLVASSRTSDLDIDLWIDPSVQKGEVFGFRIDGGGALMQLGPDPVSWQQSRIGIRNTHTVALGGISGHLSQLRTGGPYDLLTDTNTAFRIVEEVTEAVSSLRGRLGAFQRNQVEANMENMIDAMEIETNAWSEVKDTDFAATSSELMRLQLLMESNVTVLKYPNQNARLLLSLLQG